MLSRWIEIRRPVKKTLRWWGVALLSAGMACSALLVTGDESRTEGTYSLSQGMDVRVLLNISHMIRAREMTADDLVLTIGTDGVATGRKHYCVQSNGAEMRSSLTVSSEDGRPFSLQHSAHREKRIAMDVTVIDLKGGNARHSVHPGEKRQITAAAGINGCGAEGTTALFVSAPVTTSGMAETGSWQSVLKLTFATY